MDLSTLRYAKSHEWAKRDGDVVTVGITDFAVQALSNGNDSDLVYCDLPEPGRQLQQGETFGEIESVKAVFDLYAPATGTVSEVNAEVEKDQSLINADPYGKGWMIKIKLAAGATLDHLMTKAQYDEQLASEGH